RLPRHLPSFPTRRSSDLGVPDTLDVSHVHEAAPSAFPNGAHVAEVEIDPETGGVAVVKYTMVNDFGTVINPLMVEGQSHGGVMQDRKSTRLNSSHRTISY